VIIKKIKKTHTHKKDAKYLAQEKKTQAVGDGGLGNRTGA
jgi:hypothetical protein